MSSELTATTLPETEKAKPARLDAIDRRILALLERDAAVSIADIADHVGLSQTPCWKRIRRLERSGVIVGRVAVLDAKRLGLPLAALIFVQAANHDTEALAATAAAVAAMPEIIEAYRLAGEFDYILRVAVSDADALDDFYKRLVAAVPLRSVTTRLVLETIKSRGPLLVQE